MEEYEYHTLRDLSSCRALGAFRDKNKDYPEYVEPCDDLNVGCEALAAQM